MGISEKDAAALADALTTCYFSTAGCKRMPIRMIYETGDDGVVDCVMLCTAHADAYRPEGRVMRDTYCVSEQHRAWIKANNL